MAFVAALYAQGPQALTFFIEGEAKKFQCGRGVTQGCGLGTLLFAITFNDIIADTFETRKEKFKQTFV